MQEQKLRRNQDTFQSDSQRLLKRLFLTQFGFEKCEEWFEVIVRDITPKGSAHKTTQDAFGIGFPNSCVVVTVLGTQSGPVPLASLLPAAAANCFLMVAPTVLLAAVPTAGRVPWSLTIPNNPALTSFVLHAQMAVLEFAPAGAFAQSSVTNALTLRPGRF